MRVRAGVEIVAGEPRLPPGEARPPGVAGERRASARPVRPPEGARALEDRAQGRDQALLLGRGQRPGQLQLLGPSPAPLRSSTGGSDG